MCARRRRVTSPIFGSNILARNQRNPLFGESRPIGTSSALICTLITGLIPPSYASVYVRLQYNSFLRRR